MQCPGAPACTPPPPSYARHTAPAALQIPAIGQAYVLFRAQLKPPFTYAAGVESLEARFFEPAQLPWGELAFSSVSLALK